ncbi:metallophosphoesterase [Aureimonas frigidaquae]|uniref:metallophosphoesterase n=1 Tax=Aureimonas frigidaquae TaxID=424757 RepID=UPI0009FB8236|nr:metallophosphoesterase [Aureimonas frigidaquae]
MKTLSRLLSMRSGRSDRAGRKVHARLSLPWPTGPVYAVGDVHGSLDALLDLEREILRDAAHFPGPKCIIMLGDYVDRGPSSAQVIEHLIQPLAQDMTRLCLAGNHELVMLDYLDGRARLEDWLGYGGDKTLTSYGLDLTRLQQISSPAERDALIRQNIPQTHQTFLRHLAILVDMPGFRFVHAGYRPDKPLGRQSDWDLATVRDAFYRRSAACERIVVHGHTPRDEPVQAERRIGIDTGACFTGRLTGLRLWHNTGRFLSNRPGGSIRPAIA